MQLSLEINKRCNFACNFCYTNKANEYLPPIGKVLSLINEAANQGVTSISLTGGEPLLQMDRVIEICRHAKSMAMGVRVNTNGSILEKDTAGILVGVVDEFQVSLNASDASDFSRYTGTSLRNNMFSKTLRGCHYLLDSGGNVSIRITYTKSIVDKIYEIISFAKGISGPETSRGISKIKIRTFVPAGNLPDENDSEVMLSPLKEAIIVALRGWSGSVEYKDGSGLMPINLPFGNFSTSSCICGESSIHVNCDLKRVVPCVFLRDDNEYSLGDLSRDALDIPLLLRSPTIQRFKSISTKSQIGCRGHAACQV